MTSKSFGMVAGLIFLVIAVAHVFRVIFHFEVVLAGYSVPLWVSWVAIPVFGFLAWSGLGLSRKAGP
jgi:hypothetical protein